MRGEQKSRRAAPLASPGRPSGAARTAPSDVSTVPRETCAEVEPASALWLTWHPSQTGAYYRLMDLT